MGANWNLGLLNNRLFSSGQLVRSDKEGVIGSAWRFNIGYTNPSWWSARFWYGRYDDKFDINDIGYLRRNNLSWIGGRFELRKQEPWGPFLYNDLELKYMGEWRGDGLSLDKELEIEQNNLLSNYWSIGFFSALFYLPTAMMIYLDRTMHGNTKLKCGATLGQAFRLIAEKNYC